MRKTTQLFSVLVLSTCTAVIWFVLLIRDSYVPPPHRVTAEEHAFCAVMPRGSQALENKRQACFNELYGTGRFSL